jgi:hypothetical protein
MARSIDIPRTNNSLCSFVMNLLILSLRDTDNNAKPASSYNAALSGKKLLAKIVNAENKKPTVFCPFLSALLGIY